MTYTKASLVPSAFLQRQRTLRWSPRSDEAKGEAWGESR